MDVAPHLIPPGQARYIQDALLDNPGYTRQRGGVDRSSHDGSFPNVPTNSRSIGLASTIDPNGTSAYRILLLSADYSSGDLEARVYGRATPSAETSLTARDFFGMDLGYTYDQADAGNLFIDGRQLVFSLVGDLVGTSVLASGAISADDTWPWFDSKPCLDGGILISLGNSFGPESNPGNRHLYHWRGAGFPAYTTGTIAITQNSQAVVGTGTAWSTTTEAGMFLLDASGRYLGTVASVESDTQLTLEHNVLHLTGSGLSYSLVSVRKMFVTAPFVSVGVLTTSTSSAEVNGGLTKFKDQKLASGDVVFRASDYTYVGTVTTVESNLQLHFTGNAAQALENEPYIAIPYGGSALSWATGAMPVFTGYWNGIQFAANADDRRLGLSERSRIFILGPDIIDACDLTQTGSFYDIPSTKPHTDIRGLYPTESTLLVFLAEETLGLFGNQADQLVPKTLAQDGILAPMSADGYKGGCVWTGHRGIYFFDGASVSNLLADRAAAAHAEAVSDVNFDTRRCWSILHRDHYVSFVDRVNNWVYIHDVGRTLSTADGGMEIADDHVIYCINLKSDALTFWTNTTIRGFTHPPGRLDEENDAYYLLEDSSTQGPAICSAESLFADNYHNTPAEDEFLANPIPASNFAPHFYIESRLYDYGDPQLLKLIKQLQVQYSSDNQLGVDILYDLHRQTKAMRPLQPSTDQISTPFFKNRRVKFLKRSTHGGFRVYTMIDQVPAVVMIGTWAMGTKPQRAGRV
jgi:hypothetical protein